ncbi:MAG: ParB/RepB/Spo0J family partition protein [Verrucomicrobiae bacterium]|nr:ParB/RepB/Spo0J family partition protein [Verrucomicrobiae bacterium]
MKPVLGRGLDALLGKSSPAARPSPAGTGAAGTGAAGVTAPAGAAAAAGPSDSRERVLQVPVQRIHPCPLQPRKDFPEESLRELAESIKAQGIIQPLIVRERGEGFQLIAGERRYRAAKLAGLATVPVVVKQADDRTALEMMLVENLQRENLNPMEEALGYAELIHQFQLTQEEAAAKVGRSRASVANALRLLKLPVEVQQWLKEGQLSVGHAKVLLSLLAPEQQRLAAEKTIKEGLSVRQLEELAALWQSQPPPRKSSAAAAPAPARDVHIVDLEQRLQQRFGTRVTLRYRKGKGAVEIRFYSDAELERILDISGIKLE